MKPITTSDIVKKLTEVIEKRIPITRIIRFIFKMTGRLKTTNNSTKTIKESRIKKKLRYVAIAAVIFS